MKNESEQNKASNHEKPGCSSEDASLALHRLRHSLAHCLAQAVLELRPGSRLGFGPAIEDGFYYDFVLSSPLSEEDFPSLEKRMQELIKEDHAFVREEIPIQEAGKLLEDKGEPFKREYAEELAEKNGLSHLSFYRSGPFFDMCEGPHVERLGLIPADCFKLRSVAGAYWRGDSSRDMMTRIYAWAFGSREELEDKLRRFEEAQARDHRKIGREMEIFHIDDSVGRGLPLWLPNGTVLRDELEKLMRELEFRDGYDRVVSPHLAKADLYRRTGHLPYYADGMYPLMKSEQGEEYALKPMNCPHHHLIYASRPRSYRDLPLRLAEYGQVYRHEDSGALSGLLRARGLCINDGHIYCREDQIKDEFKRIIEMHREVYAILGISDYRLRLSRGDLNDPKGKEKYVENPEAWAWSENLLREVLEELNLKFADGPGEAAFYGPKIDFQFVSVSGREETASTIQLDFAMPERMDLSYIGPDGKQHRPFIIHRAPLGSHERFIAFLIEHYGGKFPTWLAPEQVRVIGLGEAGSEKAKQAVARLRLKMIRAREDSSGESLSKKVRQAWLARVPNVLIIGNREAERDEVTLRRRGENEQKTITLSAFEEWIESAIRLRALD